MSEGNSVSIGLAYPTVSAVCGVYRKKIRAKVNGIIRFDVSPSVLYYSGIFYIPPKSRSWLGRRMKRGKAFEVIQFTT